MMLGAVSMHNETVISLSKPLEEVFMAEMDQQINDLWLEKIQLNGHSRVPIWERSEHNIRGVILVKRLIALKPNSKRTIRSIFSYRGGQGLGRSATVRPCEVIEPDATLADALKLFAVGSHVALVASDPDRGVGTAKAAVQDAWKRGVPLPGAIHVHGFLFLEDVMEHVLHLNIIDEDDVVDVPSSMLRADKVRTGIADRGRRRGTAPGVSPVPSLSVPEQPTDELRTPLLA
jgi:metal transporter CNNM